MIKRTITRLHDSSESGALEKSVSVEKLVDVVAEVHIEAAKEMQRARRQLPFDPEASTLSQVELEDDIWSRPPVRASSLACVCHESLMA